MRFLDREWIDFFFFFPPKPLSLCYPSGSILYMEEAVCWDLAQREQLLLPWLGLHSLECKEIHGGCYDILMEYQSISPGAIPGFLILTHFFSQNMSVFKFKGYSMWILVAVRGDSLCHLPKNAGLLLTWEGEVKALLAHFSSLSTPVLQALRQSSDFCGIYIAQRPGKVVCWWQCCSRSLKSMWLGSVAPSPVGSLSDFWGQQWLSEGQLQAFLVAAKGNPPSVAFPEALLNLDEPFFFIKELQAQDKSHLIYLICKWLFFS